MARKGSMGRWHLTALQLQYSLLLSATGLGLCLCSEPGSPVAQAGIAKDDLELFIPPPPSPLPNVSTVDIHETRPIYVVLGDQTQDVTNDRQALD